jgi:hypothetical protein
VIIERISVSHKIMKLNQILNFRKTILELLEWQLAIECFEILLHFDTVKQ